MRTVTLGVDIGGTKIAVGLVDLRNGTVVARARTETRAQDGGALVLARAIELAKALVSSEGAIVSGVGIGAGGQIDPVSGIVVSATEILPGWAGQPLAPAFADAFGVFARADNDVNALALGESEFGAGRDARHLAFLALGTGVGGALIHDNKLVHGPRGAGGELGHLIIRPDAPPYENGTTGCLEQFTRGAAVASRFVEAGGDPNLSGPEIAARAHAGDSVAREAIGVVGRDLGLGLASLANLYGPEKFVLGGGVVDGFGELLLILAREEMARRALPSVARTPVVAAELGADAPVIGAATLAIETTR